MLCGFELYPRWVPLSSLLRHSKRLTPATLTSKTTMPINLKAKSHVQWTRKAGFSLNMSDQQKNRFARASNEFFSITFLKQITQVYWNGFFKKPLAKLWLFWPWVYDPPAPVRPLIQMMNQEIVRGTTLSNGPLMATHLQGGVRHFLSATDVDKTTII